MNYKLKNIKALMLICLIMVVINVLLYNKVTIAHVYSIIYLIFIYIYASDCTEFIYFTTILFSIVNANMLFPVTNRIAVYYFYITLFVYFIIKFDNKDLIINFKKLSFRNKYVRFCFVFIVYMLLSIFIANNKKNSIKSIMNYLIMFATILMFVIENKDLNKLKKTFKFIFWIWVGILLVGTMEVMGIRFNLRNHYSEMGIFSDQYNFIKRIPIVFFYNPNNYSVLLVMSILCLVVKFIYDKQTIKKPMYLILFFLANINLIFTTSRISWITLFIGYFVLLIYYAVVRKNRKYTLCIFKYSILSFVVFFSLSLVPSMNVYYGKFNSLKLLEKFNISKVEMNSNNDNRQITIGKKGSTNERATLIYDVVDGVIVNKNYLGFGAGNISEYIKIKDNTFNVYNVHSLWFEILGDFGIGIFLYYIYIYLAMIFDLLYGEFKNVDLVKISDCLIIMLITFVLLSFGPSSVVTYVPFWMLISLSINAINIKRLI